MTHVNLNSNVRQLISCMKMTSMCELNQSAKYGVFIYSGMNLRLVSGQQQRRICAAKAERVLQCVAQLFAPTRLL
jgi:hypothetical protein